MNIEIVRAKLELGIIPDAAEVIEYQNETGLVLDGLESEEETYF